MNGTPLARTPPVATVTHRCAFCGAPQPPHRREGQPCLVCGRRFRVAAPPVARAAAGWCAHHPDQPTTGVCARCGAFTCVQCEVSVGGVRYCEPCRRGMAMQLAVPVPWEERGQIGRLRAWWRTTADITARPTTMFRRMHPTDQLGSALWFGLLGATQTSAWQLMVFSMYGLIGVLTGVAMAATANAGDALASVLIGLGITLFAVFSLLAIPVFTLAAYLLLAATMHLALRVAGAGGEHGLAATIKVACYSLGTGWVGLIPYAGGMIQPIWWTVLMVIGTSRAHGCSTTRSLAVLVPMLLACVAPVVAYVAMFVAIAIVEML